MGKKAAKSTRKFAASGQLKKTIQNRKKHQQVQKKAAGRRGAGKDAKGKGKAAREDGDEDQDEEASAPVKHKGKRCVCNESPGCPVVDFESGSMKGMSVDDILGGGFMDSEEDDEV